MTTLSPFRYVQLCRYILQHVMERSVTLNKGKGKAMHPYPSLALATAAAETSRGGERSYPPPPGMIGSSSSSSSGSSSSRGPPNYRFPSLGPDPQEPAEPTEIYRLMNDERLSIPGAVKPPREVVVLCHGLYGFSTATPIPLFPSLKLHYWASVLDVLRDKMGANVLVVGVKGTGSVKERAEQMHKFLSDTLPRGSGVNFVAHSMGGLDVRHLISIIKPTSYTPLSLTTIGTPHRGSPFMDWCSANIGVGSNGGGSAAGAAMAAAASMAGSTKDGSGLPFSLKSPLLAASAEQAAKDSGGLAGFSSALSRYLLGIFDSPAYSNLTIGFLRDEFNPETPDSPNVKYTSVAGRVPKLSVFHPLWFPKLVLDAAAEKGYSEPEGKTGKDYEGNDGLVSVSSAKWGEFLGVVDDTHHWDLRGEGGIWPNGVGASKKEKDQAKKSEKDEIPGEELVMPGGDWDHSYEIDLGLGDKILKTASAVAEQASTVFPAPSKGASQSSSSSSSSSQDKKNDSSASWDVAQVGQVLDWVTDLLPGGKSTEIGRQQLEEASRQGASAGAKEKQREKEREKKRKKEFDLDRFYGGLMIKLREDGF
ncbi:Alpha/Beta hydrolase protein [Kockovaella imperatae]|uniref:Alpha/Beta hydrolase protein n=1 Tax=Kockovaella imperatae TaxID=4999 RepID=A0A1Y1UK25_9TREE|nr:Alpha/Beta hydrolase protein [Kockovaella imperatae]ORX37816.1 Alpha/Beta hydrolase protein [Kockovaella imperatae]